MKNSTSPVFTDVVKESVEKFVDKFGTSVRIIQMKSLRHSGCGICSFLAVYDYGSRTNYNPGTRIE